MKTCNACGTPMSKNKFAEDDCPECFSENFIGISNLEDQLIIGIDSEGTDEDD